MGGKFLLKIKKSVWLYPAFYSFLSILLAATVLLIDTRIWFEPQNFFHPILFTRIDLAQTILGAIAGSLLTMTTFTFSTTMVVLTMYTSQYSPRTVENFLTDNVTMKILGIFMGGFIYSILSLLFMRNSLSDFMVISASIGVVYSVVCLMYFSKFVNHVANLIQASNLIDRLYREAQDNILSYKENLKQVEIEEWIDFDGYTYEVEVKSSRSGYIQLVDRDEICSISKDISALILMNKVIGQFVTDETTVLKVYFKEKTELEEEIKNKLLDAITIDTERNEFQDFDFSIQKISEIALRAISPGINDPNTANHCIRMLGVLMGMIADLKSGYIVIKDKDTGTRGVFEAIEFEKELYFTFYQIVSYGKHDISVILSIYKALRFASKKATPENRAVIHRFVDYVYDHIDEGLKHGIDHKMIKAEEADIL